MKDPKDGYVVAPAPAAELTKKDLSSCIAIIKKGEAVDWQSALRELPLSTVMVIARKGEKIGGVGAIKRERPGYAAKVARDAQFPFPERTLELGYVAVDPSHRLRGLSHRITATLLSQYEGRLFATTYDKGMKRTLNAAGFVKKGKEWKGRKHMLSFWERGANAPTKT